MTGYYTDASGQENQLPSRFGTLAFFKDQKGMLFVLAHDDEGTEIGVTWRRKGDWLAAYNRAPGSPDKLDLVVADDPAMTD